MGETLLFIHSASPIKKTHLDWSPHLLEQPMASAEAPDVDSVPVEADGIESDDVEAQIECHYLGYKLQLWWGCLDMLRYV